MKNKEFSFLDYSFILSSDSVSVMSVLPFISILDRITYFYVSHISRLCVETKVDVSWWHRLTLWYSVLVRLFVQRKKAQVWEFSACCCCWIWWKTFGSLNGSSHVSSRPFLSLQVLFLAPISHPSLSILKQDGNEQNQICTRGKQSCFLEMWSPILFCLWNKSFSIKCWCWIIDAIIQFVQIIWFAPS